MCVPAQVDAVGPRRGLASCILSFGPVDVFDCGRSPLFASTVVIASFVRCAFALTGTFNIVNLASVVRHGLRSQLFFLSYHFFVTVVLTAFVRCAFALTGTLNIVNLAKVVCHGLRSQLFFVILFLCRGWVLAASAGNGIVVAIGVERRRDPRGLVFVDV